MPKLSKPPIDEIKKISTAIVIDQKRMGTTLRSTIGTATELYTYLRLLFLREINLLFLLLSLDLITCRECVQIVKDFESELKLM